ncbi:MAG: DUF2118 domain-containing protein [Desulfurococcales archaeon]|nr:DUF2118 domain-containing protein [Desulfurococcales archaeon]
MSLRERNSGITDYDFPRLYLKGEESREHAIVYRRAGSYKILRGPPVTGDEGESYGLVPYEAGWSLAIEPLEASVTRGMLVVVPWHDWKGLLVDEGSSISILEVRGYQPILTTREGDHVGVGEVIAYVLTGKGETRTVRTSVGGVVLYISWRRVEEEIYNVVVVDEGSVIELKRLS